MHIKSVSVGSINVESLLKAFVKFEHYRANDKTEQERAGTIQAFEFCFELAWKTMKRILAERGLVANSPKEVFRLAALDGLIDNPELWFEFLRKRNMTVHTYDQDEADDIIAICPQFSQALKNFLCIIGCLDD